VADTTKILKNWFSFTQFYINLVHQYYEKN